MIASTAMLVISRLVSSLALAGAIFRLAQVSTPAGFGEFTVTATSASLILALVDGGLLVVAIREIAGGGSRASVERGLLIARLALAAIGIAAMVAVDLRLIGGRHVGYLVTGFSAYVLLMAWSGTYYAVAQARSRVLPYVVCDGVGRLLGAAILLFSTTLPQGAALDWCGASLALGATCSIIGLRSTQGALGSGVGWRYGCSAAWRLLHDSKANAAAFVLNSLYLRIDVLLVAWLSTEAVAGEYGLAFRVVEVVLLAASFYQVAMLPKASAAKERVVPTALQGWRHMYVFGLLITMPGFVVSGAVTSVLGGGQYAVASDVLRILLVGATFSALNGITGSALLAKRQERWLILTGSLALTFNIVLNLLLIPRFGAVGAALASSSTEVLIFAVCFPLCKKILGIYPRISHLAKGTAPGLAATLIAAGASLLTNSAWGVAALTVTGVAVLLSLTVLLGRKRGVHDAVS